MRHRAGAPPPPPPLGGCGEQKLLGGASADSAWTGRQHQDNQIFTQSNGLIDLFDQISKVYDPSFPALNRSVQHPLCRCRRLGR